MPSFYSKPQIHRHGSSCLEQVYGDVLVVPNAMQYAASSSTLLSGMSSIQRTTGVHVKNAEYRPSTRTLRVISLLQPSYLRSLPPKSAAIKI